MPLHAMIEHAPAAVRWPLFVTNRASLGGRDGKRAGSLKGHPALAIWRTVERATH